MEVGAGHDNHQDVVPGEVKVTVGQPHRFFIHLACNGCCS